MHRYRLARSPLCPRDGCVEVETIRHVMWECAFAQQVWALLGVQLRRVEAGFVLDYDKVLKAWGGGRRENFVLLWIVVSLGKVAVWDARAYLLKEGRVRGEREVHSRILGDLKGRIRRDIRSLGYHAAKERWKGRFRRIALIV